MKRLLLGLLFVLSAAACGSQQPNTAFADLPAGDAARGAALFTESVSGAPTCSSCHTVDGTALVGPSMQGFAARAATRVEGQSAAEYTYNSMTQPAAYIVSGFSNTMFAQYGRLLSTQQSADLIAYLLTL